MVGRFVAVCGLLLFLRLFKFDSQLSFKQQIFIWFAGMIRGAIAFGLVLKINSKTFKNSDIIVTTTLCLVIFTTVFFGAILGLL
jgi:sodium/hydrogen exchanger 8